MSAWFAFPLAAAGAWWISGIFSDWLEKRWPE